MAKPRSGAKKATPAAKKVKSTKPGATKRGSKRVAKAASTRVKAASGRAKKAAKKATAPVRKAAKKVAASVRKATKKAAPVKRAAKKLAASVKKAAPVKRAVKKATPVKKSARKATPVKRAAKKAAASVKKAVDRVTETGSKARKKTAQAKEAITQVKETPAKETPAKVKETPAKAKRAGAKEAPVMTPPTPPIDKPKPRATRLPPPASPLNKRDMEQLLTAGQGRGVSGEGSLKGRLVVTDGMPYLQVIGRDKRELNFLLQGPDQEVLPAYLDHKVSVSGLIKKTTNYGGTVDVRKFSAKKPEEEVVPVAPEPEVSKLRFLSPGEVSQVTAAGMGAGMKGFASVRGNLEMTGEQFVLVVSHAGTRHQVSFLLEGQGTKGLRRLLGQTLQVTGVVDKTSGWGGRIVVENVELRPAESRSISRTGMEVVHLEGEQPTSLEVKLNHGFTVRLQEQPGFCWAIEPTVAKRVGLREANFELGDDGTTATREFFFTPRNPGTTEIEFFLARSLNPSQVERSFKISVTVKP